MVLVSAALIAIGHGAGQPALQAKCVGMYPEKRGVAISTFYIGLDLGNGIGPVVGGVVLSFFNFSVMYGGASVLLLLGMLAFILLFRKRSA